MTAASQTTRRKAARPPRTGRRAGWVLTGMLRVVGRALQGLLATTMLLALIVGVPWALWRFIGWPLPDHVPTWDEVQAVLLSPMTAAFLLDVLACLCWTAWLAFVIDVARCAVDAARGARWPELRSGGPVHTVAAVLIGAIVLSLTSNRNLGLTPNRPSSALTSNAPAAVSVASWQPAPAPAASELRMASHRSPLPAAESGMSAADLVTGPAKAVVREPRHGVYDSLWRIAQRELGYGARWPEIFALNEGKPQPNGGHLTNPNLIFPGEELLLPTAGSADRPPPKRGPEPPPPASPTPAPPSSPSPPSSPPSTTPPAPSAPAREEPPAVAPTTDSHSSGTDVNRPAGSSPGVGWDPAIFLGLGLAAAVSAALLVARRRYRRSYQPGSGRRDDLPVAPVVSRLRLAHLRATADPEDDHDQLSSISSSPLIIGSSRDPAELAPEPGPSSVTPQLGVRDGREIALDLAVARGLGLVGPGAAAAARALLAALLARGSTPGRTTVEASVLVVARDLTALLSTHYATADLPARLHVVADLGAALDELDDEILRRTRDERPATKWPSLVLVASPSDESSRRLQAVLDNGSPLGIVGVLLGQWRSGVTAHIRADGTVSATNPGVGEALEGTQMYRLPDVDAGNLLRLFRQAEPDNPPEQPAASGDPASMLAVSAADIPATAATGPHTPDTGGHDGGHAEDSASNSADTELEIIRPYPLPGPTQQVESRSASGGLPVVELPGRDSSADEHVAPVAITVLGPLQIRWRPDAHTNPDSTTDITAAFPPRQRDLLVFLAVHPHGVHRDVLVATLWADNPPDRPTNALNTALSRLRRALSTATDGALSDITSLREGRYQLDPTLADVDYWHFGAAVAARRAATNEPDRIAALRRVVDNYTGRLADGMDAEWIDAVREATARDAIDAVAALARAMVDTDPEYTLNLLEAARAFDPHNELLYRDIMRLQERLGQLDAIPRTLTLLTTRLAEIDEKPSPDALRLATRLQHRPEPPAASAAPTDRRPSRGDRRGDAAAS